jgi:molecular chaperone GrpE (heat shock protein)
MGRPRKKTTHTENEDEPPQTDEEQGLNQTKQGPSDPSASNQNTNKAEEQRLKELQDHLQAKQKKLEECQAKVRENSLRQKIYRIR